MGHPVGASVIRKSCQSVSNSTYTIFKFNQFGRAEIKFSELARIWEDNQYEVIIQPAGIYWTWMVDHWPKTKFIHITRESESWKKSFTLVYFPRIQVYLFKLSRAFYTEVFDHKQSVEHLMANSPFVSKSFNEGAKAMDGYLMNMIGSQG